MAVCTANRSAASCQLSACHLTSDQPTLQGLQEPPPQTHGPFWPSTPDPPNQGAPNPAVPAGGCEGCGLVPVPEQPSGHGRRDRGPLHQVLEHPHGRVPQHHRHGVAGVCWGREGGKLGGRAQGLQARQLGLGSTLPARGLRSPQLDEAAELCPHSRGGLFQTQWTGRGAASVPNVRTCCAQCAGVRAAVEPARARDPVQPWLLQEPALPVEVPQPDQGGSCHHAAAIPLLHLCALASKHACTN